MALTIASDGYMASSLFTSRKRAAIKWAELEDMNTARKREDGFADMKKHFGTAAIMKLSALCGYYNMFSRVHDSRRQPPCEDGGAEEIECAIRIDPKSVKAYLKSVVKEWPESFLDPNKE